MKVWFLLAVAAACAATPLDDYVSKPDPHYKWTDTGQRIKTLLGGTAYILNVTSQKWLDTSRAHGPNGDLWMHTVAVVVPKNLRMTNFSMAYLTGDCNEGGHLPPYGDTDGDLLVADDISHTTGAIGIVVYQLPNCPIVYPSDPSHRGRGEDAMIAWAWNEYFVDPSHDPEWLPRLPMTKGAMQSMRAAQEFITEKKWADIEGWFVAGASKRGWTTWTVGAVNCSTCVNIVGIAPLVPIVPDLIKEVHHQWQAYNGFTFAFKDYLATNLTTHIDDPIFAKAMSIVDPKYYIDRLARLPKIVVDSSDDEFMMFEWTNIWWDSMKGETRLLIAPNSEHSLITGIPEVLTSLGNCIKSIFWGHDSRPGFTHTYDATTGIITVSLAEGSAKPAKVVMHHAHTLQSKRRDFRWIRQANNFTGPCVKPDVPTKHDHFGANCLQPIDWRATHLKEKDGVWTAHPPSPPTDMWVGYYVEMYFPSDTDLDSQYQFTTPGYVWPDTLPFPPCHGEGCIGRPV